MDLSAWTGPSPRVRGIRRSDARKPTLKGSIPAGAGNPCLIGPFNGAHRVHPRGCGESAVRQEEGPGGLGPSPRVRGILARRDRQPARAGSIPAGAGNPTRGQLRPSTLRVHPRGCGESSMSSPPLSAGRGPSPRVRGIPGRPTAGGPPRGSIPAGAGNPMATVSLRSVSWVHPRGCGESGGYSSSPCRRPGPSPRVRGIPCGLVPSRERPGSIPAGAGNPPTLGRRSSTTGVHPRGCGESAAKGLYQITGDGPSPRVRGIPAATPPTPDVHGSIPAGAGNPSRGRDVHLGGGGPSPRVRGIRGALGGHARGAGSIPAGAGNPLARIPPFRSPPVHPRGCGESVAAPPRYQDRPGPSPRVRGIPAAPAAAGCCSRSIPAGAGNPAAIEFLQHRHGVHPRGCGESCHRASARPERPGLSPRVRGIRGRRRRSGRVAGSIPAGAGNPSSSPPRSTRRRVHPRGCGESEGALGGEQPFEGPSPRVRGIHLRAVRHPPQAGSIPAGAGNPQGGLKCIISIRVHPRGCGESTRLLVGTAAQKGPSPRVRGIHPDPPKPVRRKGSIPAGAGNPSRAEYSSSDHRVHPRGCGESVTVTCVSTNAQGPSPRVRGILRREGRIAALPGSIPAGAGNPGRCRATRGRCRVHPRGCGESHKSIFVAGWRPGPSPRVRGIPPKGDGFTGRCGSIPAGAGNPCSRSTESLQSKVHPRGCGESSLGGRFAGGGAGPSPRVRGIPCRPWRP